MRSTIRFSQAVIWPITHMSPALDFSFFKKPLPTEVPTPPAGWKSLGASSTPWAKTPLQALEEELDKMEPTVDLTGCEDEELLTGDPSQNHVNLLIPCGMNGVIVKLQPRNLSTRRCTT